MSGMNHLKPRWCRLCEQFGLGDVAIEGWNQLNLLHETPPRAYHNLEHVSDCLEQLDSWSGEAATSTSVEMALWWHDAVYHSRAKDNELQSALLWREFAEAHPTNSEFYESVCRLIRSTDHQSCATDPEGQLIQDIDLSILGRAPEVFDDYERKIREEYSWVSQGDYIAGRSTFLKNLSHRKRIFLTGFGFAKYETAARANIERSLRHFAQDR